jgi:hypothetical protein
VIGEGAFADQEDLRTCDLPESLQSIGGKAFLYAGLSFVPIPASVQTISKGAFGGGQRSRLRAVHRSLSRTGFCPVATVLGSYAFARAGALQIIE